MRNKHRKIEAMTVCVGYADFLSFTAGLNKNHFDRMVVVTHPDDKETQAVCEYWHIQCVLSDACYRDGAKFNKGAMINAGLRTLDRDGWVLHLDADIYLPPRTGEILRSLPLCSLTLYSWDRMMCPDFKAWIKFLFSPARLHGGDGLMRLETFPVGSRLLKLDGEGYVPIGYSQLWNPIDSGVVKYPEEHNAADRTDTQFSLKWPRQFRQLIPEMFCIHLESESVPMGANWQGRTTRHFGWQLFGGNK